MNDPQSPNLEQPHDFIRSRTPEARNAARKAEFEGRQRARQDEIAAKNAQPKAGINVRVRGGQMIDATASGDSLPALQFVADSNGALVFVDLDGRITGTVPPPAP